MKIIHSYILKQFLKNLVFCLFVSTFLFLVIDFFDRIDNIAGKGAGIWLTVEYFMYKIPGLIHLMLPVSALVTTMLTIGMMSKNSEITAMRTSGMSIFWLARPLFAAGFVLSLLAVLFNETIVPHCARREKEIYNIDIQRKDESGRYSQENFWWRSKNRFYSINAFDSRSNTLLDFSSFTINPDFEIEARTDAREVRWADKNLGWSMYGVSEYVFKNSGVIKTRIYKNLTLPIREKPNYFYDVKLVPEAMSYLRLRKHLKKLTKEGISTVRYKTDLYSKLAFPFVNLIAILVALPFALKPARSGTLGISFVAGLVLGFSYYAVFSFSISMGRAELINPLLAAWMANIVLGMVGLVLNWGAEAP